MALSDPSQWSERIVIASRCEEAQAIIEHMLNQLRRAGWHEDDVFAVHVALEESLSNAIKHGNRNDPSKKVTVSYRLAADHVEVQVQDEGKGFDPSKVPDPTDPAHMNATSGRGLCLIRGFMDEVQFREGGRVVWMSRKRRYFEPDSSHFQPNRDA